MSNIYNLRSKMLSLLSVGLISIDEYDSLFAVLDGALELMPMGAADVARTVQLIEKLLPAAGPGGRMYVVGEPVMVECTLERAQHIMQVMQANVALATPAVELVGVELYTRKDVEISRLLTDEIPARHQAAWPDTLVDILKIEVGVELPPSIFRASSYTYKKKQKKTLEPPVYRGYMSGRQTRYPRD